MAVLVKTALDVQFLLSELIESRPPWSELDEAFFVPETSYLVLGFCERPPTQLGGMFLV
jgi:hypothetical protein